MHTEARDKVTEILGFAPSYENERDWIWETTTNGFRLVASLDGKFVVFIRNNLKPSPTICRVCSDLNEVIEATTEYYNKVLSRQPDVDRYLRVMWDIKWRTEIIGYMVREDHPNKDISLLPLFMKVETIALHIRTVIEFIALASLAANKSLFEQESDKFKEFWKADLIFRDIEKGNPDFYPKPIEPINITDIDDVGRNIRLIKDGYMTRDMCLEVYQKCCDFLHAQNPFAEDQSRRDYEDFMRQVPDWIKRIANLLNFHVFRLAGSNDFHVVHMHDEATGDYPFLYRFSYEELPPEPQAQFQG